jgi:hypothetical protein
VTLHTVGTLTRSCRRRPPGRATAYIPRRPSVKKLVVVLLAAGVGFAAWRKAESGKSHEKLWAEATDKVG